MNGSASNTTPTDSASPVELHEAEVTYRSQSTTRRPSYEARFPDVKAFDQVEWSALKASPATGSAVSKVFHDAARSNKIKTGTAFGNAPITGGRLYLAFAGVGGISL